MIKLLVILASVFICAYGSDDSPQKSLFHLTHLPSKISQEEEEDLRAYMAWAYDQPARITDGVGNIERQSWLRQTHGKVPYRPTGVTRRSLLLELLRCSLFPKNHIHKANVEMAQRWSLNPFHSEPCEDIPFLCRHIQTASGSIVRLDAFLENLFIESEPPLKFDRHSYSFLSECLNQMMRARIGNCGEYIVNSV